MTLRLSAVNYQEQLEVLQENTIREKLATNEWPVQDFFAALSNEWLKERQDLSLKVFRCIPKKMRAHKTVDQFVRRLAREKVFAKDEGFVFPCLQRTDTWNNLQKRYFKRSGALEARDENGASPLYRAVMEQDWVLVKHLLNADVEPEIRDLVHIDLAGMSPLIDGKAGCSALQMKGIVEKVLSGQWNQIEIPKKLSSAQKNRLLSYVDIKLSKANSRPFLFDELKNMHLGKPCRKMRRLFQWLSLSEVGLQAQIQWIWREKLWDLLDLVLKTGIGLSCWVECDQDWLPLGQALFQYAPYKIARQYAIGSGAVCAGYHPLQLDLERDRFIGIPIHGNGERCFGEFWRRLLEIEDPWCLDQSEYGLFSHLRDSDAIPWLGGLSVLQPNEREAIAQHFESLLDQPSDLCWASPPLVALLISAPGGLDRMKDKWRCLLPVQEPFAQEHCMFAWITPVIECTLSDPELVEFLERDIDVALAMLPHLSYSFRKEVEANFMKKFEALDYVQLEDLFKKVDSLENGLMDEEYQEVFNSVLVERQKASRLLTFFRGLGTFSLQAKQLADFSQSLGLLLQRLGKVALKVPRCQEEDGDREIFSVIAELYPKHVRNLHEIKGRLFQRVYDRKLYTEKDLARLGLEPLTIHLESSPEDLNGSLQALLAVTKSQREILDLEIEPPKGGWKPPEMDQSVLLKQEDAWRCLWWIEEQLKGMLNRKVSESLLTRLERIERLRRQVIIELCLMDRGFYEKLSQES